MIELKEGLRSIDPKSQHVGRSTKLASQSSQQAQALLWPSAMIKHMQPTQQDVCRPLYCTRWYAHTAARKLEARGPCDCADTAGVCGPPALFASAQTCATVCDDSVLAQ